MKSLFIRIDHRVYERLKKESKNKRVAMGRLVEHYCEEGLRDQGAFKRLFGL